jgi:hypothetical protein
LLLIRAGMVRLDMRFTAQSSLDDILSIQIAYTQAINSFRNEISDKPLLRGFRIRLLLRRSTRTVATAVIPGHDFGEPDRDGRTYSGARNRPQTFSARSRTA